MDTLTSSPGETLSILITKSSDLKSLLSTLGFAASLKSMPSTSMRWPPETWKLMETLVLFARGMSVAVITSSFRVNSGLGFSRSSPNAAQTSVRGAKATVIKAKMSHVHKVFLKNLLVILVIKSSYLNMAMNIPAAEAEPITPARLGPMACMMSQLSGSYFRPST